MRLRLWAGSGEGQRCEEESDGCRWLREKFSFRAIARALLT
jgi:hypothetical protein